MADSAAVTLTDTSGTMHIGNMQGQTKGNWKAVVTVPVHDSNHDPVANATVSGTWTDSGKGAKNSCTTDVTGTCDVNSGKLNGVTVTTFTVEGVTGPLPYEPSDDDDLGSSIIVEK